MTVLRVYDRVRLIGNAAYGPPDRYKQVGTVVEVWTDPTGIQRMDVSFDGEDDPVPGLAASNYELVEQPS